VLRIGDAMDYFESHKEDDFGCILVAVNEDGKEVELESFTSE
jgi:hypothetical protein